MAPTTQRTLTPPTVPLTYTIASSTPHSGRYGPENILVDKPLDQSSRWSGAFQGNANQWITLRLESLAVLKTITSGKFSKPHPCNMKELKVFVGMTEDHMTEVLHAGLKNDSTPETFTLRHINDSGVPFPTHFVKILPILAHGQNFHISIWHVSLTGIIEPDYVEQVRLGYEEFRETSVLRYVLKHLRQRRLLTPYQSILSRANIHLEHPLLTQLHTALVLHGSWTQSESLLTSLASASLFTTYLLTSPPTSIWTRLRNTEDADGDVPPARGGHAMCIDPTEPGNEMIYLFGGWDGRRSLDDFWRYSVKEGRWKCLSSSTTGERNAPGARSCHKMCFDVKTGSIYVLGRLNDSDGLRAPGGVDAGPQGQSQSQSAGQTASGSASGARRGSADAQAQAQAADAESADPPRLYSSEFYRYHTRGMLAGKWDFLSIDTAASGGPPLIFDHQMVMDSDAQILYVFGGRVVDGDWDTSKYSGLYSYNVVTSKWRMLQPLTDAHGPMATQGIPPRFGHSMIFDPPSKTLYIFAGQRDDKYLSDMYAYNVETGIATEVFADFSMAGGPEACFTQRAVVDVGLREVYVFCGLTRGPAPNVRNPIAGSSSATGLSSSTLRAHLSNWVYRYAQHPRPGSGKWMQILPPSSSSSSSAGDKNRDRERDKDQSSSSSSSSSQDMPIPRFAHQVVYNPNTKTVYLHGGNAGWGYGIQGVKEPDPGADGVGSKVSDEGKEAKGEIEEREGNLVKEKRLDDFWKMELKRPGPEEVIRQAKFEIRRQQFREMCEDGPPVKALHFLQTQVASVVDHSNPKEEESFRALLTHLLAPPSISASSSTASSHSSRPTTSASSSRNRTSSSSSASSTLQHEDTREGSTRPRKRSRGEKDFDASIVPVGTPESEKSEDGSGIWTSDFIPDGGDLGGVADEAGVYLSGSVQRLREVRDPLEDLVSPHVAVDVGDTGPGPFSHGAADAAVAKEAKDKLTGARYAQRTEVFEKILKFVVESEKQPQASLLDLVESDRCWSGTGSAGVGL